jgi:superfamily II DNA or RNA helicase
LQDLIDLDYLVPPKMMQIRSTSNEVSEVMGQVLKIYQAKEAGNKAIVFMKTIEDAKAMSLAFREMGIKSDAVTSELTGSYRARVLDDYNSGDTAVLTTVEVLTMGFDSPRTSCIIMPYATTTPVPFMQRIGRGLRKCDDIGKKDCKVYVFGRSPSVPKKLYKAMQYTLNTGSEKKEFNTFKEDFDYGKLEKSSSNYSWSMDVLNAIKHCEKLNCQGLADLINEKRFPRKYLKKIKNIDDNLPKRTKGTHNQGDMTPKQKEMLTSYGIADTSGLTIYSAAILLQTIANKNDASTANGKYILASGQHQGKDIRDDSLSNYRRIMTSDYRYARSNAAKLIKEWNKEQRYG